MSRIGGEAHVFFEIFIEEPRQPLAGSKWRRQQTWTHRLTLVSLIGLQHPHQLKPALFNSNDGKDHGGPSWVSVVADGSIVISLTLMVPRTARRILLCVQFPFAVQQCFVAQRSSNAVGGVPLRAPSPVPPPEVVVVAGADPVPPGTVVGADRGTTPLR